MNPIHTWRVCLAAMMLSACGGGAPGTDGDTNPPDALPPASSANGSAREALEKLGDNEVVVQNQGGSKAGSNLQLPDGFPDDVSLPAGVNVVSTSTPLPDTQMIMGITPSAPVEAIEEFRVLMTENGWSETAFQEMTPQMTRIDFEKDDRMTNITVTLNGDTSAIQLMTGPKLG